MSDLKTFAEPQYLPYLKFPEFRELVEREHQASLKWWDSHNAWWKRKVMWLTRREEIEDRATFYAEMEKELEEETKLFESYMKAADKSKAMYLKLRAKCGPST